MWRYILFAFCLCLPLGSLSAQDISPTETALTTDEYLALIETNLTALEASLQEGLSEKEALAKVLASVQLQLGVDSKSLIENAIGIEKILATLRLSAKRLEDLGRQVSFWQTVTIITSVTTVTLGIILWVKGSK